MYSDRNISMNMKSRLMKRFVSWPNIFKYKTTIKIVKDKIINEMNYSEIIEAAHNSGNYIYEARKSGWKVKIHHFRYLEPIPDSFSKINFEDVPDFDLIYPQDESNFHETKKEIEDGLFNVFPRGGRTVVYLSKDGKEYKGESACSIDDNFDRKVGNFIAYNRALEEIK